MASIRLLIVLVIAWIAGCSGERQAEPRAALPLDTLPGVYEGIFPCAGCPGLPTALWVRADGRFFIEQRYPETDGRAAMNTHNLGRWQWIGEDGVLALQGAGPVRVFTRPGPDSLVMRTDSDLEHRLDRNPAAPRFLATIRMTGTIRMGTDGAVFTDCLAGLVAPVVRRGDYSRLLHQYRGAGKRGEPAYVELDGRFSWSDDGAPQSLTIDGFVTVRASGGC